MFLNALGRYLIALAEVRAKKYEKSLANLRL